VSLKIRYGDFTTISRSCTFDRPTCSTDELWQAARGLFDKWPFQPVRLIGITAERLTMTEGQIPLFPGESSTRHKNLDSVVDRINDKFGRRTIRRGGAE